MELQVILRKEDRHNIAEHLIIFQCECGTYVCVRKPFSTNTKIQGHNDIQAMNISKIIRQLGGFVYSPEDRRLLRKVKFSPILSKSGSSLAISSISGRALASLSAHKRK